MPGHRPVTGRQGHLPSTWDDVVQLAAGLPEVERSTSYGTPALRLRGKLLTRLRPEDDSLVLLDAPPDERDVLIEADPATFHTTPHYVGFPAVLARLDAVTPETLLSFLERRWRGVAPKRLLSAYAEARPASA